MRELTVDLFITLDGFAYGEGSPAYFGYHGPDLARWIDDQMALPQVLLFGRVTYQALTSHAGEGEAAEPTRFDEVDKIVFSNTLAAPLAWPNAGVQAGEAIDQIRRLKAEPGDPLRTMGSLSLVRGLLSAGLVDRLRLVVFPQILAVTGREPLFAGLPDLDLELLAQEVLDERLMVVEYRPTPKPVKPAPRP